MSYQKITGPLMANSHPGSYTGQDAYNDMFVTEKTNEMVHWQRAGRSTGTQPYGGCIELHARSTGDFKRGGYSMDDNSTAVVRRLTPLECERLQGFPDGWTDIGEWVDTKGRTHKEADSPRYKALGNTIAIPFWFYVLRRISAQYERPATLGSLFDGIGGFPLCWERCNGEGTAIWASEIDEFCIAVTKKHFPEEKDEQEQ